MLAFDRCMSHVHAVCYESTHVAVRAHDSRSSTVIRTEASSLSSAVGHMVVPGTSYWNGELNSKNKVQKWNKTKW